MDGARRLPPGQRVLGSFPRFGAGMSRAAPAVPADPVLRIRGAVTEELDLPLSTLATLPRRELVADFHCVTGWSTVDLHWEGVAFGTVHRTLIEPVLRPGAVVTHVVFRGLDGFRSVLTVEDALGEDVLIAEHLDGRPLGADHGAPARLISPGQYGYLNIKHLCRIDLLTAEPSRPHRSRVMRLLGPHPRARVWAEERHRHLPAWSVRRLYRASIAPMLRHGAQDG